MNKIKFLKKYTYTSILDVDFNVVINFDYDAEVLLYSLEIENNNYNSIDYLIEYATSLSEDEINNAIREFMLDYVKSDLNSYIQKNGYNEWVVVVVENGLKLINKTTKQWATWNIYDYDEDYEVVQSKVIKSLKLQHNQ